MYQGAIVISKNIGTPKYIVPNIDIETSNYRNTLERCS